MRLLAFLLLPFMFAQARREERHASDDAGPVRLRYPRA